MNKHQILEIMEQSEDQQVRVVDARGETFDGYVDLFESRYDNEDDDEPYSGEASIGFDCDDGTRVMVYESDIRSIKIVE